MNLCSLLQLRMQHLCLKAHDALLIVCWRPSGCTAHLHSSCHSETRLLCKKVCHQWTGPTCMLSMASCNSERTYATKQELKQIVAGLPQILDTLGNVYRLVTPCCTMLTTDSCVDIQNAYQATLICKLKLLSFIYCVQNARQLVSACNATKVHPPLHLSTGVLPCKFSWYILNLLQSIISNRISNRTKASPIMYCY